MNTEMHLFFYRLKVWFFLDFLDGRFNTYAANLLFIINIVNSFNEIVFSP